MQGIGEGAATPPACAHPALGQSRRELPHDASGPYATFRNPFVYFHGLTDSPSCATDDVGLSALDGDLSNAKRTPSVSYIVPDRCHDGSPGPCPAAGRAALPAADSLLAQIVPKILASHGLQARRAARDHQPTRRRRAAHSPTRARAAASRTFPTCPQRPGSRRACRREGGGQVGALLLSPFVKAPRPARNRLTTSRCCARSRTCSASSTSAMPPRRRSKRSRRRCSPPSRRTRRPPPGRPPPAAAGAARR